MAVLGLHRLEAAEDAVRAAPADVPVTAVSDETETAVRVEAGRIVARADGRGSCYAAAARGAATRP